MTPEGEGRNRHRKLMVATNQIMKSWTSTLLKKMITMTNLIIIMDLATKKSTKNFPIRNSNYLKRIGWDTIVIGPILWLHKMQRKYLNRRHHFHKHNFIISRKHLSVLELHLIMQLWQQDHQLSRLQELIKMRDFGLNRYMEHQLETDNKD